jgi:Uma2 family endonuclease
MTAIIGGAHLVVSDDDLLRISVENPGWQFERNDAGALLVSPPTLTPGGAKSGEAFGQLRDHAKRFGGKAFDAATGFKTPRGGVVSPAASWGSAERVAPFLSDHGFWQMMPDVVIEIAIKSDRWSRITAKIDKYAKDGAGYALAINPETGEIYERGTPPPGLALDIAAIIDA